MQESVVSPSSPVRKHLTPSGSQGTKGLRVFEGRHSPLGYHPKIVQICRIIFYFHAIYHYYRLSSNAIWITIFYFYFSHHTPRLQALWKVPSAQCHFTCNKLTNKLTNKPLQKMSDMEKLAKSLEQADLVGEFKRLNKCYHYVMIITL